jgi:hypothetical protein
MDGQLFKIIGEDLKEFHRILRELEDLNILELRIEIDFLKSLLKNIKEKMVPPFAERNTFDSMQINSIIDFEVEIIENKIILLSQSQTLIQKTAISYLLNKLKCWVKNFSARLWQIICNLLTPYEWSIQGGIGNQSLLGLGNVQVQIKFGKNKKTNS